MSHEIEETPFDVFKKDAEKDIKAYHQRVKDNGVSSFIQDVNLIIRFSQDATPHTMINLFGEDLGMHLWGKLVNHYDRDMLNFIMSLSSEYKVYFLYSIKTTDYKIHMPRD